MTDGYSIKTTEEEKPCSAAEGLWLLALWWECRSLPQMAQVHRLWWPCVRTVNLRISLSLEKKSDFLHLTSIFSALGCFCAGWVCAPLPLHSWPVEELLSSLSPVPHRGAAENQTWLCSPPSFWKEQEAQRRWMWPWSRLRDNDDSNCIC